VKDHVIQQIQKSYKDSDDLVTSLKKMTKVDLSQEKPKRTISILADADKETEQKGFDIEFQEELSRYLDRVKTLEQGLKKAYALIMSTYCTKSMQTRIEEHPDFEDEIDDDPIALLKAIKECMHDPVRAQYPIASMTEAVKRLVTAKQQEGESVSEYARRIKELRDVVTSYLGPDILDNFIERQDEYKKTVGMPAKTALKVGAFERWVAYLLISGSDQSKYGSVMKGFVSQYSLGNDQYPTTVSTATDVLAQHRYDQRYFDLRDKKKDKNKKNEQEREKEREQQHTSFAQQRDRDSICYCCGKPGHRSPDCTKADTIPKKDWYCNKAMAHLQNEEAKTPDEENETDDDSVRSARSRRSERGRSRSRRREDEDEAGWSGFTIDLDSEEVGMVNASKANPSKRTILDECIILDSGSNLDTFKNADLVTNIRMSRRPLIMHTNAGTKRIDLEATVPTYRTVRYDPDQIANIFGLGNVVNRGHQVTYDSEKEDAFLMHTANGIVKFERTAEGLYAYKPSTKYLNEVASKKRMQPPEPRERTKTSNDTDKGIGCLVSTVNENRKGYTKRQFEDAKLARRLYHIMGCPTVENFKKILRQNIVINCPVTPQHVDIAEAIFGPDIGALKGKTTRQRPLPV
jgi:hypothetical protein